MTNRLILFDFDETYYKHRTNQADIPYLKEMESLLQNITAKNNVITAILTGSTIESVLQKMSKVNMSYLFFNVGKNVNNFSSITL